MTVKKLSEKQKKWIEFYNSGFSAAEAAKKAGYVKKSDDGFLKQGALNLELLKEHINANECILPDRAKALKELIDFWSEIINDTDTDIRQRIKASELKAKATGVFSDTDTDNDAESEKVMFFGEGELFE